MLLQERQKELEEADKYLQQQLKAQAEQIE